VIAVNPATILVLQPLLARRLGEWPRHPVYVTAIACTGGGVRGGGGVYWVIDATTAFLASRTKSPLATSRVRSA
jgi:hypothetical protein